MDSKSINNFVINIKASYIINTFLYDYIDMKGYLDDIKEYNDPDEIKVVGYNFQNDIILVSVIYFDECLACSTGYEEISIDLDDFIEWMKEN